MYTYIYILHICIYSPPPPPQPLWCGCEVALGLRVVGFLGLGFQSGLRALGLIGFCLGFRALILVATPSLSSARRFAKANNLELREAAPPWLVDQKLKV